MKLFYFLIIFITVIYYYHTHPILFHYFFPSLPFFIKKIFHYWFLFFYSVYSFTSDLMFCLYLKCILHYSLDCTIVGIKITLIMCSFII